MKPSSDAPSPDPSQPEPHSSSQHDLPKIDHVQENLSESEYSEIEQSLQNAEESFNRLKQRYADVISAKTHRSQLRAQYNRTQRELQRHKTNQLKSELDSLQHQLDEVEVMLESQLFSWSSLKEPFWMAVRFGGLGIVVGWVLRSLAAG